MYAYCMCVIVLPLGLFCSIYVANANHNQRIKLVGWMIMHKTQLVKAFVIQWLQFFFFYLKVSNEIYAICKTLSVLFDSRYNGWSTKVKDEFFFSYDVEEDLFAKADWLMCCGLNLHLILSWKIRIRVYFIWIHLDFKI